MKKKLYNRKHLKNLNSKDYKNRFIAEYVELKNRHQALSELLEKYKNGELDFEPTCPIDILKKQKSFMTGYLNILEKRAELEGIDLSKE